MNETKTQRPVQTLAMAAIMMALGFVLPFFTGQIPQIGGMLCPMHLPVLLCGLLCGWRYGLAVGFLLPLLRSVTLGMPPMFPTAVAMAFELAAYGFLAGFLYAIPGIILQLVFIPAVMVALDRTGLVRFRRGGETVPAA